MKKVIVIYRSLSSDEIHELNYLMDKDPGLEIFTTTGQPLPFATKIFEQGAECKRDINFRVIDALLSFGEKSFENETITDALIINGMSLWHYHKFRIYFLVRNLCYEHALLTDFCSNYQNVVWYTHSKEIEFLCASKNLQLVYPENKERPAIDYTSMIKYAVFTAYRFLRGVIASKPKARHILIDRSIKQPCLDIETLKLRKDNYNLAYVFSKALKDFMIIDEVEMPKFIKGTKFSFQKWMFVNTHKHLKQVTGEYILIRSLFSLRTLKHFKQEDKAIKHKLNLIKSSLTQELDMLIINYLQRFHGATRFYIFKKLAYQNYFRRNHFLSLSSIDENSPAVKCIMDAAKANNITTFGIQHGNMHDLHPAYRYTKADKNRSIVPDFTLVWGEHWKTFLLKIAEYPENSLMVAGQSRTDIIPILQKIEASLKKKLKLPDSPIVVFASQLQQDPLLRERAAKDVLNLSAEMPEIHLVIKLHPSEANDAAYYNEIAKSVHSANYSIVNEMDLYELIASCQLLITCFSTVGTETIYFGKPLIILDYLKQDLQRYIGSDVAYGAYNSSDLIQISKKILSADLTPNKNAYKQYIYEHSFKIDGNASQRIIDLILEHS